MSSCSAFLEAKVHCYFLSFFLSLLGGVGQVHDCAWFLKAVLVNFVLITLGNSFKHEYRPENYEFWVIRYSVISPLP